MLKKSFLILTLLLLSLKPTYAAFSDVPTEHIYKDAINYVQEQGIVNGYSDGTFRPDNPITRGEFTKIIVNTTYPQDDIVNCKNTAEDINGTKKYAGAFGEGITYFNLFPDIVGGDLGLASRIKDVEACNIYDDVNKTPWECIEGYNGIENKFYDYVRVAKENNIVSGYSDGTFRPDANITVGEASKIIANAFGIFDKKYGEPSEYDWFSPYLRSINAVIAMPYTLKDREQKLTRGEMADLIAKLKYHKEEKDFVNETTNLELRKVKIYFHDSKIDPEVSDCSANNYYEAFVPFDSSPVRRTVEYVLNTYNLTGQHGYEIESLNLVDGQADIVINRTGYGYGTCGGAIVSTSIEKSVEAIEGVTNATVTGSESTFI